MKKNQLFSPPRGKMKKLLFMQLFILVLLLAVLPGMASTHAQEKINLEIRNASMKEVFESIQEQTAYRFLYYSDDIKSFETIDLVIKNADINTVLDQLFSGSGLSYSLKDEIILIKKAPKEKPQGYRVIIGNITDEKKLPIPGVTITIKGFAFGTVTDKQGNYRLSVPLSRTPEKRDSIILLFSFVGMESQEIFYTGQERIDIVMQEHIKHVDEVVVTGYQSINKKEMTGSAQTVKREDLFYDGTGTIEQMLQGRLAGTLVMNTSGLVGSRQRVRVRGTSTLLGNQEPVWVVDGIIQEDKLPFQMQEFGSFGAINQDNFDIIRNFVGNAISWLNPNDIEDITVLKDAQATSLYGVKAANGVILITTKKGQAGRISLSYSGDFALSPRINYNNMELMDSKERVDVSREIYQRGLVSNNRPLETVGYEGVLKKYLQKEITYKEFNEQVKYLETVNTDWFDILFRNSLSQSHSISLSGGSDKITYYWSAGMRMANGTAKGNDQKSYTASVTISSWLNDKISTSLRLSGEMTETESFAGEDPYSYASTTSRAIPCWDENGEPYFYQKYGTSGSKLYNILNELNETGNRNDSKSLSLNFDLKYDILKGLRYQTTFGLGYSSSHGESWASELTFEISNLRGYEFGEYRPSDLMYQRSSLPHGGRLNSTEDRNFNYTWKNLLSYNTTLAEKHRFSILAGVELRSSQYDGSSATNYGYLPGRGKTFAQLPITKLGGNNTMEANSLLNKITKRITDRISNYVGLMASASYSFKEKYVFSFNVRSDASNRFGQDTRNRFLPVWSAGVRWNAADEKWMQSLNIFNELSFRATYGWQGNVLENYGPDLIARIPDYPIEYLTGEYTLKISSLPYADLRWEKTQNLNLGVDLGFLKNRLMASFEYYHKKTKDMIIHKDVPYLFGVNSMPINGGTMSNSGWDLSVSATPVRTSNFVWNISLNTAKVYNKLETTIEQDKRWSRAANGQVNVKGYPVNSFWAIEFLGLKSDTGLPIYNIPTLEEMPGSDEDATLYMKHMGTSEPNFSGGLSTSFRYKNLSLSMNFNLNTGVKRFLAPVFQENYVANNIPSAYSNLPKEMVNRWRKPGDDRFTTIPSLPSSGQEATYLPGKISEYTHRLYNYTDIRVVRADFLRCNGISLSYTLPKELVQNLGVKNISLSGNVGNPFIITTSDFKGRDPEVATGSQPVSRNYALSVNISF